MGKEGKAYIPMKLNSWDWQDAINRLDLTVTTRHVLFTLALYAGQDGKCNPSHESVAERAGVSVASVKNALNAAKKAGLIKWSRTDWASEYQFVYSAELLAALAKNDLPPSYDLATPSLNASYPLAKSELPPSQDLATNSKENYQENRKENLLGKPEKSATPKEDPNNPPGDNYLWNARKEKWVYSPPIGAYN